MAVVVDGGATKFCTPHRHHFLPGTLRPTNIQVRGMDKRLHRANGVGIVQLHLYDRAQNKVWRITCEGILVDKVMPSSFTLLSIPQLNVDGISLTQPAVGQMPSLYVGSENEPIYSAPLNLTESRLPYFTALTPQEVNDYITTGAELTDLTSSPSNVITGDLRSIQGFTHEINLMPEIVEETLNTEAIDDDTQHDDSDESNHSDDSDEASEKSRATAATFKAKEFSDKLKKCLERLGTNDMSLDDRRFIEEFLPWKTRQVLSSTPSRASSDPTPSLNGSSARPDMIFDPETASTSPTQPTRYALTEPK